MKKVKVVEKGGYRDGGTIRYLGEDGRFYFEDHRIKVKKTLNEGKIYDRHPNEKNAKLLNVELIKKCPACGKLN